MSKEAPYGTFKSPITADEILKGSVKFVNLCHDNKNIYFAELRPLDKARVEIVKFENGKFEDQLVNYSARTKVHEYGGVSFTVKNNEIYFSNFEDQKIYKRDKNGKIYPITKNPNERYVDIVIDEKRKLLYAVQEEHLENKVINTIVSIDEKTSKIKKIAEGFDFYASLALSPDNTKICFLAWNQPDMPWDSATLFVADIIDENGNLANLEKIAGSENESIFQPRWSKNGDLYFVSDKTNFWNLYRLKNGKIESIYPMKAEFGYPQWLFGFSYYDFYYENGKTFIIASYFKEGVSKLAKIDPENKSLKNFDLPFTFFDSLNIFENELLFIAGSPSEPLSIYRLNLKTDKYEIIKKSKDIQIDPGYISIPQNIEFPTENNKTAYMIYYPPKNKDYKGLKNEKPPLIVKSHGGPTSHSQAILDLEIQYFTSRGFAFADVNYGGSTGYGREFRQRLYKNWGIIDVDDCVNAAKYLVKKGLADENRLIIRGGSAGGFTTLAALTFRDVFKAGASYYGVSDIEALVKDTHKFEAKYEEKLIGPYPKEKQTFFERSPINFAENLSCPIILFQGEDDKVVPPNQAEMMFESLLKKNIPAAYLLFKKEGHGFRSAPNIKRAIEAELYFYSKIFDFEIFDEIEPIEIFNLEKK